MEDTRVNAENVSSGIVHGQEREPWFHDRWTQREFKESVRIYSSDPNTGSYHHTFEASLTLDHGENGTLCNTGELNISMRTDMPGEEPDAAVAFEIPIHGFGAFVELLRRIGEAGGIMTPPATAPDAQPSIPRLGDVGFRPEIDPDEGYANQRVHASCGPWVEVAITRQQQAPDEPAFTYLDISGDAFDECEALGHVNGVGTRFGISADSPSQHAWLLRTLRDGLTAVIQRAERVGMIPRLDADSES